MRGFILNPTYRVVRGTPEVHLYGVLESGEPCLIVDDRVRPYFFVRASDASKVEGVAPGLQLEPCDLRSLAGEPVARVRLASPAEVPGLRTRLEDHGVACLEADVRFAYRYLIDRGIRGAFEVDGSSEVQGRLGRVYRNPSSLSPAHWSPSLKILSIDIETDPRASSLYSIALHTPDFAHVILVHERMCDGAEHVHSEKAAVRRFLEYVELIDPDVITGWNVIDFDLAVLARIARNHGLRFAIGRNDDEFGLRKDATFTRESRAVIFGRLVLDGLSLVRGAFIRLDDYKLETAAQALLGKGKLITGDLRHHEIEAAYRENPQRLVDYNLRDAELVSEILERTGLVQLAVERSLLTGMQLDRVSAAIASIDSLYLNALRKRGIVAPSVGTNGAEARIAGGYVMESKPGLYRNVLVFDFKSLYPSIIRTYNIDPMTKIGAPTAGVPTLRAPNQVFFRRDAEGIIPGLLARLAREREQARRAGNAVKSNAIKILMNSFYGVLGASASRLFSPEIANAITQFGQLLIRRAAEGAAARGYDVIYGDTDSLFVDTGERDPGKSQQLGERLCKEIGADVAAFVHEEYGCESFLELEFEKLYLRFFLPEVRGGKVGSKKRYAGLIDRNGKREIEFVGLESVRRDWSEVSKRFQRGLLERVFHDRPVDDFVRSFLADLHNGRFDEQLVYRKAIRKGLDAYTKTTPPHVKAARKQGDMARGIIAYVMTRSGPEPVDQLTAAPDYAHYVDHQIAPIADAVLRFLGTSFVDVAQTRKQLALF